MSVPVAVVVGAAGVKLDEPDAPLDQAPGQQAAAAEVAGPVLVDPVEFLRLGRLVVDPDGLGGVALHGEAIS